MEMTINMDIKYDLLRECVDHIKDAPDRAVQAAMLLTEIRDAHPSDNAFRDALDEHDIAIEKNERAAMIRFGRLPQEQRTTIIHFMRHEGRIRFQKLPDDLWTVSARAETESQPVKISETVETAPIPQSDEQIAVSEEVKTDRVKSKPSKSFADRERADDVAHVVEKWSQKAKVIGAVHPKAGWPLLLEAIDLGLLSESGTSAEKPSARCLFNLPTTRPAGEYLGRYDLSTPKGCKTIAEDLMPFLRRNAEALKTDPMQFMPLWNAEAEAARLERVAKQEAESKAKRMAAMQERGEEELVICGVTVWPYPETNIRPFTYEDLRHAFYLFVMAEKMTHIQLVDGVESPSRRSRSINHRHMANEMVKQLGETLGEDSLEKMTPVQTAWHNLSRALENGDLSATVETKRPSNWNHFKVA